jgi:hypothetical protein
MKLGIVLPSRNRPAGLKRMVASLLDNAAKPDRVRIFVGLDDDDSTLEQAKALNLKGCELVIGPAETTCAAMIDKLALQAEQWADATIRMDDDFVLETRGWDDNAECMTGLGFWRPDDPTHARGFMSFAAMSTEMARWLRATQGFVHAPWFPFWFTDTWNSEIGDMAAMKAPLDVRMTQPEGRGVTHGMRDLRFWAEFFDGFRTMRAKVAAKLIRDAYPAGNLRESALYRLPELAQLCENAAARLSSDEFVAQFEAKAETFAGTSDVRYRKAKADAEALIAGAIGKAA